MQQKQFSILKLFVVASLIVSMGTNCKKNNNTTQQPTPPAGFVFIPAPTEKDSIGSGSVEPVYGQEKPRHRIQLSPFFMAKYELTIKEFNAFIQAGYKDTATYYTEFNSRPETHPVIQVSWIDAAKYCNWRSKTAGLDSCYVFKTGGVEIDSYHFGTPGNTKNGYRLPTEAEWEYACRAHSDSVYSIGNTGKNTIKAFDANFGSATLFTVAVNSYQPNAFGLYNMHGNVWELCTDWYDGSYYTSDASKLLNPPGPATGPGRVIRGGSWSDFAVDLRSASRGNVTPVNRFSYIGFRLAKTL